MKVSLFSAVLVKAREYTTPSTMETCSYIQASLWSLPEAFVKPAHSHYETVTVINLEPRLRLFPIGSFNLKIIGPGESLKSEYI